MPCDEASLFPSVIRCLVSLFPICIPAPCQRRMEPVKRRVDACWDLLLNLCVCYRKHSLVLPPLLSASLRCLYSWDPSSERLASLEMIKHLKTYQVLKLYCQESGSCSVLGMLRSCRTSRCSLQTPTDIANPHVQPALQTLSCFLRNDNFWHFIFTASALSAIC